MSNTTDKRKKILNTLKRHQSDVDEKLAVSLINDFMQLSGILEALKTTDSRAFNAFFALLRRNIELEEVIAERGIRIAKLQCGQTQPK
ncbi:MAG: hypothetical protein WC736_09760 [Gallionella sp.]|jgi:hypothetical protein